MSKADLSKLPAVEKTLQALGEIDFELPTNGLIGNAYSLIIDLILLS